MKSTGIVRKVDELGRIVLPIELRRTLDIAERDELEIYLDDDKVVLKKYEPSCIFCWFCPDSLPIRCSSMYGLILSSCCPIRNEGLSLV